MRELKFRAWYYREDIKKWLCFESTLKGIVEDDGYGEEYEDYIWEQYTGLKDTNGKEVYDGDIISFSIPHFDKSTLGYDGETDLVGKIVFEYDRFVVEDKDGVQYDLYSAEEGEVIGNIHENKELLKGEE